MGALLAALLLLQDKTAEEILKKIDGELEKAVTLQLKFKCEGGASEGEKRSSYRGEGFILLNADGRFSVSCSSKLTIANQEEPFDARFVSDGKTMLFSCNKRTWTGHPSSAFSTARFKENLLRLGAWRTIWLAGSYGDLLNVGGGGLLPTEEIKLSDLREGPKSDRGKTLVFATEYRTERFEDRVNRSETVLEYEPGTFRLLGRKVVFKGDGSASMTENYEVFSLNADIPKEQFTVPETKK